MARAEGFEPPWASPNSFQDYLVMTASIYPHMARGLRFELRHTEVSICLVGRPLQPLGYPRICVLSGVQFQSRASLMDFVPFAGWSPVTFHCTGQYCLLLTFNACLLIDGGQSGNRTHKTSLLRRIRIPVPSFVQIEGTWITVTPLYTPIRPVLRWVTFFPPTRILPVRV